jgi:hypothetical protein
VGTYSAAFAIVFVYVECRGAEFGDGVVGAQAVAVVAGEAVAAAQAAASFVEGGVLVVPAYRLIEALGAPEQTELGLDALGSDPSQSGVDANLCATCLSGLTSATFSAVARSRNNASGSRSVCHGDKAEGNLGGPDFNTCLCRDLWNGMDALMRPLR